MVMVLLYKGLRLQEKKKFSEAIVFFDFLMRFDRELELVGRFLSLYSFLEHILVIQTSSKKFTSFSSFKGKLISKSEEGDEVHQMKFD